MDELDDVVAHYARMREEDRLTAGVGELELLRTQEVLRRHLPPAPSRIIDVGGATGIHAEWLLDDGYDVHLVDLTPRHVDEALARLGGRGLTAEVGDARRLSLADANADAVLLLGPLYHLHEVADRLTVLAEARRVVRLGGLVAAAAISRFASLFDGLTRELLFEPAFRAVVERDLADGRHRNPGDNPAWFTRAFFHRPDELQAEVTTAGLVDVQLVGLEGLAGWLPHLAARWDDPEDRELILRTARLVEAEPSLLGLSSHLLAIAHRPGRS
jgi:ubiquinone/menaquinone biosynthesis C-methylase UbiE